MELNIPIKPLSVNEAWQGKRFKSKFYKKYERDMAQLLPVARETASEWYTVIYEFGLPPRSFGISDAANFEKQLTDILVKRGYISDDRRILQITCRKVRSPEFYVKVWINPA